LGHHSRPARSERDAGARSDDSWKYFAAFDWTAPSSGAYRMRVTFFESVITGTLRVSRK
jgi:hypothetical protein